MGYVKIKDYDDISSTSTPECRNSESDDQCSESLCRIIDPARISSSPRILTDPPSTKGTPKKMVRLASFGEGRKSAPTLLSADHAFSSQPIRRLSAIALSEGTTKFLSSTLGSKSHTLATLVDSGSGRKFSAIIDNTTRVPVAMLGTDGKRLSVHAITKSSISQLFLDPLGILPESPRKVSYYGLPVTLGSCRSKADSFHDMAHPRRVTLTDYKALQEVGDKVLMSDYKVINTSVAYVIFFIITSIVFFALWKGDVWVLFLIAGITGLLIAMSLSYVKVHFMLKDRRHQKDYTQLRRATLPSEEEIV